VNDAQAVIDASALLALIFGERLSVGRDRFENGIMSTVNLTEVLAKMVDAGVSAADAMADVEALGLNLAVVDFAREGAVSAAELRAETKRLGLSLGDRACLATARSRSLPVLTADQSWAKLEGFEIMLAR
jgi:PIN domain nuclease of toxin-antitoxin system